MLDDVGRSVAEFMHLAGLCLVFYALILIGLSFGRGSLVGGLLKAVMYGGIGMFLMRLSG